MNETKPFNISKQLVMQAYKLVKRNKGAAGIDQQSLEEFDENLKDNLYKLWNRMASGSYFPPAVRAVEIPKKQGGKRTLGIPTVADRIAQAVVKLIFEPLVEPYFHQDSYGYRPNKSALEAVGITRERCWKYDWVLEYDIKGLFDNINHELLMRAVRKHTTNKWVILYIERWLKAPMQDIKRNLIERTCGTPQGGVISPVLSNVFLHYVFDAWMTRYYLDVPWCRYSDDGLMHCRTEQEAQQMMEAIKQRFEECKLELHPEKTKIIYCKDRKRKGDQKNTKFDFLGYTFRPRAVKDTRKNEVFLGYGPGVSNKALTSMRERIKKSGFGRRTEISLNEIAEQYNPIIQGWINYYGKFTKSAMNKIFRYFNQTLVKWAMHKYRKFKRHKTRASNFIENIKKRERNLFVHWKYGNESWFA